MCAQRFSVYGLCLQTDLPLRGFFSTDSLAPPDLFLSQASPAEQQEWACAAGALWYTSPSRADSGEPILQVWKRPEGAHRFRFADGIEFLLDHAARRVFAHWPSRMALEDAAAYFVGPILGFFLRLQGHVPLHASAVAVGKHAIGLMGPPAAGKSTVAAALATRGHSVLSDDLLVLGERPGSYWVQPGYPRVNLWPDSVSALFGAADHLPLITAGWDKRYLDLSGAAHRFHAQPLPLAAIYQLGEQGSDRPVVEPLTPRDALMALISNTYVNYLLDASMRAREFSFLGSLVARVPVRRVASARDARTLAQIPDAILADFDSLRSSAKA